MRLGWSRLQAAAPVPTHERAPCICCGEGGTLCQDRLPETSSIGFRVSKLQQTLKNQQPLEVSAARCGPFSVCPALKSLVAELSQKKSRDKHWTALLPCKPGSWCLKQNSSGVEAWKASIPPLTLDFLAVLVQSSTRQLLDRPIPSLASQPPLFRFPYSTWTSHAPSKDSLLRHLGPGRLLTWLGVGRHAHVLGRFRRHLERPP